MCDLLKAIFDGNLKRQDSHGYMHYGTFSTEIYLTSMQCCLRCQVRFIAVHKKNKENKENKKLSRAIFDWGGL